MAEPPRAIGSIGRSKSFPDLLSHATLAAKKVASSTAHHYSIESLKNRGGKEVDCCDLIAMLAHCIFWNTAECCQETSICCLDCIISCLRTSDSNVPIPGQTEKKD